MNLIILYPCSQAQEACGALEIDNALDMIKALEDELNQIKLTANDGKLLPLPGETVNWSVAPSVLIRYTKSLHVNIICDLNHQLVGGRGVKTAKFNPLFLLTKYQFEIMHAQADRRTHKQCETCLCAIIV